MTVAGVVAANLVFTVIGAGVLVIARVARTTDEMRERWPLAPIAGMATVGIIGATSEPLHVGIGIPVLFLLALASLIVLVACLEHVPRAPRPPWSPLDRVVGALSCVALAVVGTITVLTFWITPIVKYDSWAMWALKGRALADFGWANPQVFDNAAYRPLHLEYPLLLPVIHAVAIRAVGSYEGRIVILQCLFIGVAGLLALWGTLRDWVRPSVLLPCVLAIAIVPGMFGQLATAYADVPLAVFILVAMATSARWLVDPRPSWLVIATVFLIAAGLTKNEGVLFATATYLGLLLAAGGRRRLLIIASGVAFGLAMAPWRIQIRRHHSGGVGDYDLASPLGSGDRPERIHRGLEALHRLLGFALEPDRFGLLLPLAIAAVITAMVVGAYRIGVLLSTFLIVSFAGLTWVYAISPLELDSYLAASGDRVVTAIVLSGAAVAPLVLGEPAHPKRERGRSARASGSDAR